MRNYLRQTIVVLVVLSLAAILYAASGSDLFERGDTYPLDGPWTNFLITDGDYFRIDGGAAAPGSVSGTYSEALFNGYSSAANQEATIELKQFNTTGVGSAGVILRHTGTVDWDYTQYMCVAWRGSSSTTNIYTNSNSNLNSIASENSTTWAATDTLKCKIEGSSINLYRNSNPVALLSISNEAYTNGQPGIAAVDTSATTTTRIESFSSADVAAATGQRRRAVIIQ